MSLFADCWRVLVIAIVEYSQLTDCSFFASVFPHRGLPPWRGGGAYGAYAPMIQTIFNLKERS